MGQMKQKKILATMLMAFAASAAFADITVGVTVSATGPAASLGIPEKNTIALVPTTITSRSRPPKEISELPTASGAT